MHLIEYSHEAAKALARMPRDVRLLVQSKVEPVAVGTSMASTVPRMQGRPEFRLRVQDWRVIYRVLDDRVVLLIIKIGVRGQVYE